MPTRRAFLSATTGLLGGAAASHALLPPPHLSAAETRVTPDLVRLTPDIEPLVRLIEETPREKCFEMIGQRLRDGLPYRQFLAALFLAGIRNVNPQPPGFKFHCVFVIHAAHQTSLDAPVQDRLLPLFWALDNFKASQQKDVEQGDFQLNPVTVKLPSPENAWQEFHAAMDQWDEAKADRAIAAIARTCGSHQVIEQLWRYGARDYRNIGHKAIFVANTWRTLQTIGWRHAEPALRSLVLGLLDFGKTEHVNAYAFEDQSYLPNVELARRSLKQLPIDWMLAKRNREATESLLPGLRSGAVSDTTAAALASMIDGHAGAPEIWDAVHLAAGELMMRQPGIYGIHTVTSSNALRYAYETAADPETRLVMLLQGLGWMCQFKNFMAGKPQGMKDVEIGGPLEGDDEPPESASVEAIFALVDKDPAAAARQAVQYGRQHPVPATFTQTANQFLLRKAMDAHDFKYASSIFEDYRRVSPVWRPHMLATATYYLRGSNSPDSPVMRRAAEVIASL